MAPEVRTASFRAMGTDCHVTVVGGADDDLAAAVGRVAHCEARWSRFRPDSELCRLNRAAGAPVVLPRDTFELVTAAVECWRLTSGRFDPTILDALERAGYDATFAEASRVARASAPAPGCAAIELDDELGAVTVPAGVRLDLGGIAKGHTADLVADLVLDRGAAGVLVNLGGDIRVAGVPADGDAWTLSVADPFAPDDDLVEVRLVEGALATSSRVRRCWRDGDAELHHLIDPTTGRPATSDIAAVSIVAATALWAEVTAKAALIAGADAAPGLVAAAGVTGFVVDRDGTLMSLDGAEVYA